MPTSIPSSKEQYSGWVRLPRRQWARGTYLYVLTVEDGNDRDRPSFRWRCPGS